MTSELNLAVAITISVLKVNQGMLAKKLLTMWLTKQ
jgi:hypothetical protein